MRKQEAAGQFLGRTNRATCRRVIHDFTPCTWGNRFYELSAYQLSGKRYTPSLLHGTRPRYASGTLMSLRAIPLSSYRGSWCLGALCPSSAPAGDPPSQSSGTLMSLPEGIATPGRQQPASLNCREVHPVLARQLRVCLHKALRSRTRRTIDAHTLITHRLKQAQQLRGHAVSRQQRAVSVSQL